MPSVLNGFLAFTSRERPITLSGLAILNLDVEPSIVLGIEIDEEEFAATFFEAGDMVAQLPSNN